MSDARKPVDALLADVNEYYSAKVGEHGASHRGADWNSKASQELRFDRLLEIVDVPHLPFSLNDYGCGYGALLDYLETRFPDVRYRGFDLSEAMLATAGATHPNVERRDFVNDAALLSPADYTVASGVFNVRLKAPVPTWQRYVLDTLEQIATLSTRGFSFNMLTTHSDAERMRADLYYADPLFFFEHCRQRFSRRVALLHDYPLYEFTILVRLA
jgi:SAM-dependent methyltransferase